jgi:hypothetical protein
MPSFPTEVTDALAQLPSSFEEGVRYAKTPVPSDLDRTFSSLLSFFMTSEDTLKQELFNKLSGKSSFLLVFASRMAEWAIRTGDHSKLLSAVMALVLEDFHPDGRDTMVRLSMVRHAALKTGADCAALMRQAAQHARPEAAETFEKMARRRPRLRDLSEMGYKEGTSPEGFVFVQQR